MANSINSRFARRGSRCVRVTAAGPLLAAFTTTLGVACASSLSASTIPPVSQAVRAVTQCRDDRSLAVVEAGWPVISIIRAARGGGSGDREDDESPAVEAGAEEEWVTLRIGDVLSKLLRVIRALLGFDGGGVGGAGNSKASTGISFKEAFEANYGERHPRFTQRSFKEATEQAWSRNRLCLVYIAADREGGRERKIDDAICKALADPQVVSFVDENFVMWVPTGKSKGRRGAAAAAAARRVGAQSLPFLGVVHASSSTDKMTLERKLTCSTVALHHFNPLPSPGKMMSWMTKVLDLQRGALELERAEQRRLKDEDVIHSERVQGYSQSLKDDALREAREAEEEAERARIEAEERRIEEAREAKQKEDAERRVRKASELGEEPSETAVAGLSSSLMLRLADGTRVRRRFLRTDSMGKVLDWADVQGVDLDTQRLSCSFPKASFAYPNDAALSIEDAGLGKQTLLFVEQKQKEAGPARGRGDDKAAARAEGGEP